MIIKVPGDSTTMIDINVARTGKYGHNVEELLYAVRGFPDKYRD